MDTNEEMVYSEMGFDPILLLEETPKNENYMVNIVRPGEKANEEEVENSKNLVPHQNKDFIKEDKSNIQGKVNEKVLEEEEEVVVVVEEVETNNIDLDQERNDLDSADKVSINEKDELDLPVTKESDEDPRRKRRRSSASSQK